MRVTNKHNLPQTLVRLVENDGYTRGKAKMSITSLISPPRIVQLRKRFDDDIEIDVADMIWVVFGRAMHTVLEQGGDETHIPEERLFARVLGWDISGAVDLQMLGDINGEAIARIRDYKSASVWSVIFGKPDWINQLNCYAWLVTKTKDIRVESLGVVAFLKDWNRKDAAKDPDYPPTPIVEVDIPLWSYEEQTRYIEERVLLHQEAELSQMFDESLPECTDEERWTRRSDWSVMYPKGDRAYRCFPDTPDGEAQARALALKMKPTGGKPYGVKRRVGDRNRCAGNFCRVSQWCDQWQGERAAAKHEEDKALAVFVGDSREG